MKYSKEWKTLTRDQKAAWRDWAKNNPVVLENREVRRVNAQKAFTIVLNNRAIAGEAANPTTVPAPVTWLENALSMNDAGPFTENAGYVGFRGVSELLTPTKWFVWATPPVNDTELHPEKLLRFITCLSLESIPEDDIVTEINAEYAAVCGSWDGPGEAGAWPVDTYIWFQVNQYVDGQLGPGVVMKGRIQVEL